MKIDLITKFFSKEKEIYSYILGRKESYFHHECYTRLEKRVQRLNDCYDLKIGTGNWVGKIVLPILKEQMRVIRALTMQYFRPDPPVTLEPALDTPYENARNATMLLNENYKQTEWRRTFWRPCVANASRLGTSVSYTYYFESNGSIKRTVSDPFGYNKRVSVSKHIQSVKNESIDILNYFQNPECIDPEASDFQGHTDIVLLHEMISCYESQSEYYIRANLAKAIEDARKGGGVSRSDNAKATDDSRLALERIRYWGLVNIKGNEDDSTIYYCEIIGGHIVRFQSDVYDHNIKPYSIFNFEKRYEYWWGNLDSESLLPHEQYLNLLLSINADSALQQTQRIRLFQKGKIDPAQVANIADNNGFLGVDLAMGEDLSKIVHELQYQERSLSNVEYMSKEMKESMQRMSIKPDLMRGQMQGGPANKTATGASIIASQSEMLATDFLESFSDGLAHQAKINIIILQQMLEGQIMVRPGIKEIHKILSKPEIMGEFAYVPKTSLQTNNILKGQQILNAITQMVNFKKAMPNELQAMNITRLVRSYMDSIDLPEETENYLPEANEMAMPGAKTSGLPQQAQEAAQKAMEAPVGIQQGPQDPMRFKK